MKAGLKNVVSAMLICDVRCTRINISAVIYDYGKTQKLYNLCRDI